MRGFVRQRSPGTWQVGWKERDSVSGAWNQKTTTFRGTKKQADAELAKIINSINCGGYVEPTRMTVREFLERWLRDYVAIHMPKTGTRVEYETIVKRHLIPALGAILLAKLSAPKVQEYYRTKLAGGRLQGTGKKGESKATGRPLSEKTVRNHHMALHKALDCAVRWGWWPATSATPWTRRRSHRGK